MSNKKKHAGEGGADPRLPSAVFKEELAELDQRWTSVYGENGPYQTGVEPLTQLTFALGQNRPNPFPGGVTLIEYVIPQQMRVTLQVYDVSGRLVRTLVSGSVSAGRNRVTWDGRDNFGSPVASGVYFYRLGNGTESLTRKGILLR